MAYIISLCAIVLAFYYYKTIRPHSEFMVRLIYFELIYNLIIKFLIGNIGLPSLSNYISDVVIILMILEYLYQKKGRNLRVYKSLFITSSSLFIATIISYCLNVYSPFLYIWGLRINFRFIIFAIFCSLYLKKKDIFTIYNIIFGFYVLNIFVVTYQSFFVSYSAPSRGDYISGLYSIGTERGGNASLCWQMVIVSTYAILKYLNGIGSVKNLIFCIVSSLYIAALAEVKTYFVLLFIILVFAFLFSKKNPKVLLVAIVGIILLLIGINLLYIFFPSFDNFFDLENMLSYVTRSGGYSSASRGAGIDRLTVFPYVFKNYLTTPIQRLFGIGIGNAEFSSFSFLTSSFYRHNGWSAYTFFSSSMVLIELGIIGFILYLVYFTNFGFFSYVKLHHSKTSITPYETCVFQTTIIISLITVIIVFANQSMKLEASAYMVNCFLAFPFIASKRSDYTPLGYSMIKRKLIIKLGILK